MRDIKITRLYDDIDYVYYLDGEIAGRIYQSLNKRGCLFCGNGNEIGTAGIGKIYKHMKKRDEEISKRGGR